MQASLALFQGSFQRTKPTGLSAVGHFFLVSWCLCSIGAVDRSVTNTRNTCPGTLLPISGPLSSEFCTLTGSQRQSSLPLRFPPRRPLQRVPSSSGAEGLGAQAQGYLLGTEPRNRGTSSVT